MRLFYFILISFFLHILAFVLIQPHNSVQQKKYSPYQLSIKILKKQTNNLQDELADPKSKKTQTKKILGEKKQKVRIVEQEKLIKNLVEKTELAETIVPEVNQDHSKNYLAVKDVDTKALPIGNIDISMVSDVYRPGVVVSLRLFINMYGRLDKIERITFNKDDLQFVERLEALLKEATFIPAKKNGLNVDSFQEIEFSI
jgi:seryl-tRNA synthetase